MSSKLAFSYLIEQSADVDYAYHKFDFWQAKCQPFHQAKPGVSKCNFNFKVLTVFQVLKKHVDIKFSLQYALKMCNQCWHKHAESRANTWYTPMLALRYFITCLVIMTGCFIWTRHFSALKQFLNLIVSVFRIKKELRRSD